MKNWFKNQSLSYPKRSILISVVLTTIFSYGLNWLVIDDNFMNMLPEDIESRRIWEEIEEEFGASELMFVSFGEEGKSAFRSEIFATLWDLTERLEAKPSIIEVLSIASTSRMDSEDGFMEVGELQSHRDLSQNELLDIKDYLDRNPDLSSRFISKSGEYMSLAIRPKDGDNVLEFTKQVLDITKPLLSNYSVHYAGNSYITGVVPEIVKEDVSKLMGIGIIIMVVMLLANLRNISAVGMVLLVIIMSMLSMLGSMGWIFHLTKIEYFNFTMMNTSMPIVLLTIANSDGVHFLTRFFRELRKKRDVRLAVETSLDALFMPIFLTSLTTSIAFLTLISSPINHMMGYGVAIAFGILWAWILSVLLLPSMILLKKWNLNSNSIMKSGYLERWTELLGKNILKYPEKYY